MGTIAEGGGRGCEASGRGGSVSSRPPEGRGHCRDAGTKELAGVCLFFFHYIPTPYQIHTSPLLLTL